jgi:hypothetical protein
MPDVPFFDAIEPIKEAGKEKPSGEENHPRPNPAAEGEGAKRAPPGPEGT